MEMAKWMFFVGLGLIFISALIWVGVPIGRLPGDFSYQSGSTQIYIPLTSSLLFSLILSFVLWMISRS